MIDLGLTNAQQRAYRAALRASTSLRFTATVLDRNERPIAELTAPASQLLGGQVVMDAAQDVTRQLQMEVVDPSGDLGLGADSAADVALGPASMVAVRYGIQLADGSWVDVPVFWGPLSRFERAGDTVGIEALGKESLLQPPNARIRSLTARKGWKVTKAIRELAGAAGEDRFDLPEVARRLRRHVSVAPREPLWPVLQRLARSTNRQLFYDGLGRLRLRHRPTHPLFEFTVGDDATILDAPAVKYDLGTDLRNTIFVKGPTPKLSVYVHAPKTHPFSPESLSRKGQRRFMVETIEARNVKRKKQARRIGRREMDSRLGTKAEADISVLPVPDLEEYDIVLIRTDQGTERLRIEKLTLPLGAEPMILGQVRRVAARRKR